MTRRLPFGLGDVERSRGEKASSPGASVRGLGATARRLRSLPRPRSAGFPWVAPTWPGGAVRELDEPTLGIDYDTTWARRYPARLARAMVTEGVTRPLVHAIARPNLAGLDRLDGLQAPVIFMSNHASHLDTPLLLTSLPERYRHHTVVAAGADYFFDKRWKAALWAFAVSAIPIERTRVNRRSGDLAVDLVRQGWNLLIFPEGTRSPDGWGTPFKGIPAYVALKADAPVVPIHLEGTARIIPRSGARLRPGATTVTFGRPLMPAEGEDARRFAARIEREVSALADEQASDWWSARRRAAAGSSPTLTGPASGAWRRAWTLERRRLDRRRPRRRWPDI